MNLATHGPAAFTSALARIENRLPSARYRCKCPKPLLRRAFPQRVRVWTWEPLSREATALTTPSRAPSPHKSESYTLLLISLLRACHYPNIQLLHTRILTP